MRAGWPSHHRFHCFSCCILTVDSQESLTGHMPAVCAHCRPLHHNKSERSLAFQEALPSLLHLCPALPMGSCGLGLAERVQPIHFSSIAESLYHPPPYLTQSLAPTVSSHTPGGWAGGLATQSHLVALGMLGGKHSIRNSRCITPYH